MRTNLVLSSLPFAPTMLFVNLSAYGLFFVLSPHFASVFAFDIVKDYSGVTFFDEWDFYGHWDNLTLGESSKRLSPVFMSAM